jgi:hypothetical protein
VRARTSGARVSIRWATNCADIEPPCLAPRCVRALRRGSPCARTKTFEHTYEQQMGIEPETFGNADSGGATKLIPAKSMIHIMCLTGKIDSAPGTPFSPTGREQGAALSFDR